MVATRQLRIVIPGGTGQIGYLLARHFHAQGHIVSTVSRFPRARAWEAIHWDAENLGPWVSSLDGADVVINLAGSSVNCRYTTANRKRIFDSRVCTTQLVGKAVWQCERPPLLWLNASTAAINRDSLDSAIDESDGQMSRGFSMELAAAWEAAFHAARAPGTRKVLMRMAPMMSPDSGGIFNILLRMVRLGLGGAAGSGEQYVSWIHDADFIRATEFVIAREDISGAVNIASPNPIPNRQFMCSLRRAWSTGYVGLPLPEWMVELGAFLLRTESELLLKSRRIIPSLLLNHGFDFHFPEWRGASENLVARWREMRQD